MKLPAAGIPAWCSSATCFPPSSVAAFAPKPARSTRCCAGSTRCRGGAASSPTSCSAASAGRWRLPAASASHRRYCLPESTPWCAAGSTACRCTSPNPTATPATSVPPKRPCESCIAPASPTTISPRSRTGFTPKIQERTRRRTRPRLPHRFPACRLFSPAKCAVPARVLRRSAASSQAQTPLRS